jgi:hypothetical protein
MDNNTYDELPIETKEAIDKEVVLIDRGFIIWSLLMASAIMLPVLLLILKPDQYLFNTWFQRSGSVIVVISLLSEIKLISLQQIIPSEKHNYLIMNEYLKNKYKNPLNFASYATYSFVAIGTMIWGYGDILVGK